MGLLYPQAWRRWCLQVERTVYARSNDGTPCYLYIRASMVKFGEMPLHYSPRNQTFSSFFFWWEVFGFCTFVSSQTNCLFLHAWGSLQSETVLKRHQVRSYRLPLTGIEIVEIEVRPYLNSLKSTSDSVYKSSPILSWGAGIFCASQFYFFYIFFTGFENSCAEDC